MDFQGQKEAEQWTTRLLVAFAALGFLLGYALGSFQLMVIVYSAGGVAALALVVPDWPMFNKHPVEWLPPLKQQQQQQQAVAKVQDGSTSEAAALLPDKKPTSGSSSSRRRA